MPRSPSMTAWLTFTRLVKVHLRYGLCNCARPRTGSGATFVRRCSRVSVALNTYAIATQSTNLLLRQDFHLQETEQLAMRSGRNVPVVINRAVVSLD
jgi:hypothetical protein